MPLEVFRQSVFTGGELDPAMVARRDLKAYGSMLAYSLNLMPRPQGPLHRRPGLEHIDLIRNRLEAVATGGATVTAPSGGTPANLTDGAGMTTTTNLGATSGYVIAEFDFGAPVAIGMVDLTDFAFIAAGGAVAPPPPDYPWYDPNNPLEIQP